MRQFECARRRTVGKVEFGEFKSACGVIATAEVELGTMVGECKRMLCQERFETRSGGREMQCRFASVTGGVGDVRETPGHFWVLNM